MTRQFKNLLIFLRDWFLWLAPVAIFILSLIIPTKLFKLDFLRFIEIIIWPITILTALFFFKKVFTYLFFSMNEFNFFGLKGHLRNVNEVIVDEVNKKLLEREKEDKRRKDTERLNEEIEKKEQEISSARGNANENLKLAREALDGWKNTIKVKDKTIKDISDENRRLNEILSSISPKAINESNINESDDEKNTSDPILEETNN